MQNKILKGPWLSKHDFRTAEKAGYKLDMWTFTGDRSPINPGYRVYLPEGVEDKTPDTVLHIVLRNKDGTELCRATVSPQLKKTAIDGGYWEEIKDDTGINVLKTGEHFVGAERVWEVNVNDPLDMDYRKPGCFNPPPGKYTFSIRIDINKGPSFEFDELPPYRRYGSRDPAAIKGKDS
jgi:hypothetical protein